MERQLTLREVIQEVMERSALDTDTLGEKYAIQDHATFHGSGHTWSSYCLATVDLQEQKKVELWGQDGTTGRQAEYLRPFFQPSDLYKDMILLTIKRYRNLEAGEHDPPQSAERGPGDVLHDLDNGELCQTTGDSLASRLDDELGQHNRPRLPSTTLDCFPSEPDHD